MNINAQEIESAQGNVIIPANIFKKSDDIKIKSNEVMREPTKVKSI